MTSAREIRAGNTITLRTRFQDDLSENAQASNVYVHIFEPETTAFILSNALVVSGVATYFGEGIFEYDFPVPACGPEGNWYDYWAGELTCQTVSGLFNFEVSADGTVESLPSQLNNNNIVMVTLASGITATDGTTLADEYEFEFLTTISPAYTSTRKIRLEVGGFIGNLPDYTIQSAILEGSIEADILTFQKTETNEAVYQHARREYVTCVASSVLLNNIAAGTLRSKTLGDLSVSYDTNALKSVMNRILDCQDKWLPQVMACGLAKDAANPVGVVKGWKDPDRPPMTRMWQATEDGVVSRRMPAGNARSRPVGKRRFLRTYSKRYW